MTEPRENLLKRMLSWLRAGYPQGIPQQDYIALFGILHRDLTDHEVDAIAKALRDGPAGLDGEISSEEISRMIQQTVHQRADEEDVRRVAGRLAEGGWPLAPIGEGV
ncbi:DUF3349 domain-containing protein [Nigerium massiliense]|uniref:DUF3349 domain-containing protein n=1 Tax=Nigerium massiliense TaxID=1522317 RepID=UPI00058F56CD|nr:DUF3349 domain-containing protein [Nigerium massiliense]